MFPRCSHRQAFSEETTHWTSHGYDEDVAPGFLLSVSGLRMRVLFVFLEGEGDGQWCAVAGPGCLDEFMV